MQYYEAYDDVLDEDFGDAFDDGYDDAFDDGYDDAYEDSDGEDFGEARKSRSERRAARARRQQMRRIKRSERRNPKAKAPAKPAATGDVKAAFNNVGQDLNKVNRDLQREKAKQANEQINELIALFLFRPKLTRLPETTKDVKVIIPPLSLNATTAEKIEEVKKALEKALGEKVNFGAEGPTKAKLTEALAAASEAAGVTTKATEIRVNEKSI